MLEKLIKWSHFHARKWTWIRNALLDVDGLQLLVVLSEALLLHELLDVRVGLPAGQKQQLNICLITKAESKQLTRRAKTLTSMWSPPRLLPGERSGPGTRRWSPWRTGSWSRTWCSGWGSRVRRCRRVQRWSNRAWADWTGLSGKHTGKRILRKDKKKKSWSNWNVWKTHLYPTTACDRECQTPGWLERLAYGQTQSPFSHLQACTRGCTGGKLPVNMVQWMNGACGMKTSSPHWDSPQNSLCSDLLAQLWERSAHVGEGLIVNNMPVEDVELVHRHRLLDERTKQSSLKLNNKLWTRKYDFYFYFSIPD